MAQSPCGDAGPLGSELLGLLCARPWHSGDRDLYRVGGDQRPKKSLCT